MKLDSFFLASRRQREELGATAAEYVLMLSGIALALVAATVLLGSRMSDVFDSLTTTLF